MSQTASTSTASSRFQVIFNDALKLYQKQTKKDLTTHPLVSQLQPCNSTTAIISVLQAQVREFDEACGDDERLTKWLNPTVNVLCAFSAAVSGGVSLVSLNTRASPGLEVPLKYTLKVFSPASAIFAGIGVFLIVSILPFHRADSSHAEGPIGRQGCCSKQRYSCRTLRAHRILFHTARDIYRGDTDCCDDGDNHADNGGSN